MASAAQFIDGLPGYEVKPVRPPPTVGGVIQTPGYKGWAMEGKAAERMIANNFPDAPRGPGAIIQDGVKTPRPPINFTMPSRGQLVPVASNLPSNPAAEAFAPKVAQPGTSLVPRAVNWAPPNAQPAAEAFTRAEVMDNLARGKAAQTAQAYASAQPTAPLTAPGPAKTAAGFLSKLVNNPVTRALTSPLAVGAQLALHSGGTNEGEDAMFSPGGKFNPGTPAPAPASAPTAPAQAAPAIQPPTPAPAQVSPPVQPAAPTPNPATTDQVEFLRRQGITKDKVVNHGAGMSQADAQTAELKNFGKGGHGMNYQLSGLGDQNSIYASASKPGGKLDTFTGAGTGKASSPGSFSGNVVPAAAIKSLDLNTSQAVSTALNAAADRGDWKAVQNHYANKGESFNGKAPPLPYSTGVMKTLAEIEALKAQQANATAQLGINQGTLDMHKAKASQEVAMLQEQANDNKTVRAARQAYQDAIDKNDAAAMKKSRDKLVGLGALKEPTNEFTFVPNTMGGGALVDKNNGSGTMIGPDGQVAGVFSAKQGGKPQNVTPADIAATAKKYGMSEAEVKRQLGI